MNYMPKFGEIYYFIKIPGNTVESMANDLTAYDLLLIEKGFAFRTREEAERNRDKVTAFYKSVMEKVEVEEDEE